MLNAVSIPSSLLLTLPQGATRVSSLPFPNGSLMPGKIVQGNQGMAMLQMGNRQIPIKLPPQLPAGNLWILVMDNSAPPKLRIMNESQAVSILAARLAESADAGEAKQSRSLQQQEWPVKQQQSQQQLNFHASETTNRLFVDDQDGSPRGVVERESDEDGFTLHGKLDLDTLGRIFFAISGRAEGDMNMHVRAARPESFSQLQQPFGAWSEQQESVTASLSAGNEPIIKPANRARKA